jgi:hypothetical protein
MDKLYLAVGKAVINTIVISAAMEVGVSIYNNGCIYVPKAARKGKEFFDYAYEQASHINIAFWR